MLRRPYRGYCCSCDFFAVGDCCAFVKLLVLALVRVHAQPARCSHQGTHARMTLPGPRLGASATGSGPASALRLELGARLQAACGPGSATVTVSARWRACQWASTQPGQRVNLATRSRPGGASVAAGRRVGRWSPSPGHLTASRCSESGWVRIYCMSEFNRGAPSPPRGGGTRPGLPVDSSGARPGNSETGFN